MKAIIEVSNISKKYRIGKTQSYHTLRDTIVEYIHNTFQTIFNKKGNKDELANDEFWALDNVSFKVHEGEVLGVVGRNGAGKSTLLKILSQITYPSKGSITMRGRVASLLEVGTGFHSELTGRENIFLNGSILGMKQKEIKKNFDAIVTFSEVGRFLDTPVKFYSSGMYMRLAFAVASHLQSEVLILDEVLAVGDIQFQKKCLGKMEDVAKKGRTVIFISHNMNMVRLLCEQTLLLDNGKTEAIGKTDKVIEKYLRTSTRVDKNQKTDLTKINRTYTSKPIIQKAWIENEKGTIVSDVSMGSPIKIYYHFKSDKIISNPGFGCTAFNLSGQQIFSFTSYLINTKQYPSIKEGTVVFNIPELPLLPGDYSLSFGLSEGKSVTVDRVDAAMNLIVKEKDLFATGTLYQNDHGVIYLKGTVDLV